LTKKTIKKPKIVTIVGNRPQFIKLAPLSAQIRKHADEMIVHSGQHYDFNMSDIFFSELGIPSPDRNLEITEKLHGAQTAKILTAIEKILMDEKPKAVIVFGDTNTTLAGALAAVKLHIPIAHIEAGPRMNDKCESPEEANRIMVDHISSMLFSPTESSLQNLVNEKVWGKAYFSGDTMYDTFMKMRPLFKSPEILRKFDGIKSFNNGDYVLVTLHRPLNVDDPGRLETIMRGMIDSGEKIIFPVHPRTRAMISKCSFQKEILSCDRISFIDPQGYIELGALQTRCRKIVTDSGGVAKESYFNKKPCVTIYPETPWPETRDAGTNTILTKISVRSVSASIKKNDPDLDFSRKYFGNGKSAEFIAKKIMEFIR